MKFLCLAALLGMGACSLGSDLGGFTPPDDRDSGGAGDTSTDTGGDTRTDAADAADSPADVADDDTDDGCTPNACGGCNPLDGALGDSCGPCSAGTLVCDGDAGFVCSGDDGLNACGGCGEIAEIGSECGCADSRWKCIELEAVCVDRDGLPVGNACGGCAALDGVVNDPCGTCDTGVLKCDPGGESLSCQDDLGEAARNLCGGCAPLQGGPDEPCGLCDAGVTRCHNADTLVCDEGNTALNACGGCGQLQAEVGAGCGTCMSGTYVCASPDSVRCDDEQPLNLCGGCERLGGVPGESCGTCGEWVCSGVDRVRCDGDNVNVCGGCSTIVEPIGSSCGECGTIACQEGDAVCDDHERNACGGCGALQGTLGGECGVCNMGRLRCDGEDNLMCIGGSDGQNACGGCGTLPAQPGTPCGACQDGEWDCEEINNVTCVPAEGSDCGPFDLVEIGPGSFIQGTPDRDPCAQGDDPTRLTTLTRGFRIGATEVTQGQWDAVLDQPSPECTTCPVTGVNFWQVLVWLNTASEQLGMDSCYALADCQGDFEACNQNCTSFRCREATFMAGCTGFRLPTESEWEYAARAGTVTDTHGGDLTQTTACRPADPALGPIAWYCTNDVLIVQSVAGKGANDWSLYDTLGNASEWVWDAYGPYALDETIDPIGMEGNSRTRVVRGGHIGTTPCMTRSAVRAAADPDGASSRRGFRAATNLR